MEHLAQSSQLADLSLVITRLPAILSQHSLLRVACSETTSPSQALASLGSNQVLVAQLPKHKTKHLRACLTMQKVNLAHSLELSPKININQINLKNRWWKVRKVPASLAVVSYSQRATFSHQIPAVCFLKPTTLPRTQPSTPRTSAQPTAPSSTIIHPVNRVHPASWQHPTRVCLDKPIVSRFKTHFSKQRRHPLEVECCLGKLVPKTIFSRILRAPPCTTTNLTK